MGVSPQISPQISVPNGEMIVQASAPAEAQGMRIFRPGDRGVVVPEGCEVVLRERREKKGYLGVRRAENPHPLRFRRRRRLHYHLTIRHRNLRRNLRRYTHLSGGCENCGSGREGGEFVAVAAGVTVAVVKALAVGVAVVAVVVVVRGGFVAAAAGAVGAELGRAVGFLDDEGGVGCAHFWCRGGE